MQLPKRSEPLKSDGSGKSGSGLLGSKDCVYLPMCNACVCRKGVDIPGFGFFLTDNPDYN